MTDFSAPQAADRNVAEYSVTEVSNAIKRTLEGAFDHVRVRGEVGRPNYHSSGHLYFTLKDDQSVIDGVAWRGSVGKLSIKLEEGMEVICTGRVSSYPRSSRYQLVVESVELAGQGALLKLLEDRKKRLAAEGLFDPERKKPLPFLPDVIGVVTSPTGAVIRDILHRLADRFPRHVIVWPVPVQGEGAAEKIAAAIAGFNALRVGDPIARPDILIVARGGGSLEDLWAFNEEVVARAAAASEIPLISAVGHETDTTLIDFVADRRAPTPTAAAEMAVPVRAELIGQVMDDQRRLFGAMTRSLQQHRMHVEGLSRGLPRPDRLLEDAMQDLDAMTDRLARGTDGFFTGLKAKVALLAARLRSPADLLEQERRHLATLGAQLATNAGALVRHKATSYERLSPAPRLAGAMTRNLRDADARLRGAGDMLQSLSYKRVLERGYAVVRDAAGLPVARAAGAAAGADIQIEFSDGTVGATVHAAGARPAADPAPKPKPKAKPKPSDPDGGAQGSLL